MLCSSVKLGFIILVLPQMGAFMSYDILLLLSSEGFMSHKVDLCASLLPQKFLYFIKSAFNLTIAVNFNGEDFLSSTPFGILLFERDYVL